MATDKNFSGAATFFVKIGNLALKKNKPIAHKMAFYGVVLSK